MAKLVATVILPVSRQPGRPFLAQRLRSFYPQTLNPFSGKIRLKLPVDEGGGGYGVQ